MNIIPVILAGGTGTRLWPLSRKLYPKQYLPLTEERTMLQATIERLQGLDNLAEPIIICNSEHRFLVAEQLQQIDLENATILLEPVGRNTAPAIAAAATYVRNSGSGAYSQFLVLSADHVIENISAFHEAIGIAAKKSVEGNLVTFGITPTEPNTGYGYIKKSSVINSKASESHVKVYKIEKFIEKPDHKTAILLLKTNEYLWNSGMFMFNVDIFLEELTRYADEIFSTVEKSVNNANRDLDFIRLEPSAFSASPSVSIDCALMEKTNKAIVVALSAGWNDIGTWSALKEVSKKDQNGNFIKGDVFAFETINSYIQAEHRMVATIGLENLIIVETSDATLIATKDKADYVNKVVEYLQHNEREEQNRHRKVYRPWGWYDSIETGEHFQVKRLHVNPGAKLSLQMHNRRAEHWVVVKGVATATNGEETLTLTKGESTYIPVNVSHALENRENTPLEIIEVQSGSYLGEDDIVRFEDIYGR